MEGKKVFEYQVIADFFIAFANTTGDLLTNLKLQKLVYYAHAWHLAIYDTPLVNADFEAWVHGPVIPKLYQEYKSFRNKPIDREDLTEDSLRDIEKILGAAVTAHLYEVVDEYFSMSGYDLERLTHCEDPWVIARQGCARDAICHNVIDNNDMRNYYKQHMGS